MGADHRTSDRIARGLLCLYRQASAARQPAVAEHLMCALEALSRSDPACAALRDQAYLDMAAVSAASPTARTSACRSAIPPSCSTACRPRGR
jgi:hypothetical protein